jgi:ferredoxin
MLRVAMENKGVPKLYIGKDLCCGCTACYAVCPKSAIKMQEDEEGFEYPCIDESKCWLSYVLERVSTEAISSDKE